MPAPTAVMSMMSDTFIEKGCTVGGKKLYGTPGLYFINLSTFWLTLTRPQHPITFLPQISYISTSTFLWILILLLIQTSPEIAKSFPQSVYAYARFWTQPVENVKHEQFLVPQIWGFSRTSQANPYEMYMYGKLLTRRVHLCHYIRGLRRFWDYKVVLSSFSLISILCWYCFTYFSIISPLISFILFAPCLGSSLFLFRGSSQIYYWVLCRYSYIGYFSLFCIYNKEVFSPFRKREFYCLQFFLHRL